MAAAQISCAQNPIRVTIREISGSDWAMVAEESRKRVRNEYLKLRMQKGLTIMTEKGGFTLTLR